LLDNGCDGIDLGGQGSTDAATVVPWQEEWDRLESIPSQPLSSKYSPRRVADSASVAIESVLSESGDAFTTPYRNMLAIYGKEVRWDR
jgi:hypothetical protein